MIYITGDTHIPSDIGKLSAKRFREQKNMSKNDYLIICGDFGGVWDGSNEEKYWLKWLRDKSFTTLFVDGNHENFLMLNELPLIDFGGDKVHKVDEGIYHLMRGKVYLIDGKKFFTMGGATSHDKQYRTDGKNWWKEELPCDTEFSIALENLQTHNWEVDCVVTHCAPDSIQKKIAPSYNTDSLTSFLEKVKSGLVYDKWFFGHYHMDCFVDEKHIAVFDELIELI